MHVTALGKIAKEYAVLVLAAGASTRLGYPKQLLVYKNEQLIQHAIDQAVGASLGKVAVVLGSKADEIEAQISNNNVAVIRNPNWAEGIGSSIRTGTFFLADSSPSLEGIIIMVCDQPYVTAALLRTLALTHEESGMPIVASDYGGATGTPTFFHRSVFPGLKELKGDKGAKQLIVGNEERLSLVPFPLGHIDIDIKTDYELLQKYSER